jgi:hypothetical protein
MFEILSLSTAPTAGVKLQLLPSPVYCMKVFAPDGIDSIVVIGAQMDPVSAFEGLIRGTKLGYAGQMIADTFQPSSDWYKYRAVSNSAVMEWSGPSLQVNGRAYVARTNDILGLSNFNPTDVADVVAFNAEEAISISCQHVSPTYEWAGVDANVDEESNPDAILADVTETFTWALGDFITPTVQASDYFTKKEVANLWNVTFTQGLALQQQKLGDAYFQWLDTVDKKWGLYKNPVDRSFSAGHVGIFRVYGHPATGQQSVSIMPNFVGLMDSDIAGVHDAPPADTNAQDMLNEFLSAPATATHDAIENAAYPYTPDSGLVAIPSLARFNTTLTLALKFSPKMRVDSRVRRGRVIIPKARVDFASLLEPGAFFMDEHMRTPIALYSSKDLRLSVSINLRLELATTDTTPFGELVGATSSSDGNMLHSVMPVTAEAFSRVMSKMPPGVALTEDGRLTVGSRAALASRGILNQVVQLLGGAASAALDGVLPGTGSIATGFQNMLLGN